MNELAKVFKNFIYRDIVYIIGGSCVILSFLHLFDKTCIIRKDTHTAIYLFLAGLAYVIGYCVQDTASWMGIVTTSSYFKPGPIRIWFYEHFTREKWENVFPNIKDQKKEDREKKIFQRLKETEFKIKKKHRAEHERIISLMLIGTTIGPSGLVSAFLLLCKIIRWILCKYFMVFLKSLPKLDFLISAVFTKELLFDIGLAVGIIAVSVCLIILGWVKGMELTKNTEDLYNLYNSQ